MERNAEHIEYRRACVWSHRLRIIGWATIAGPAGGPWAPVVCQLRESGCQPGRHITLCALALCIEERTGRAVTHGEVFDSESQHFKRVDITKELRAQTERAIVRAFACSLRK